MRVLLADDQTEVRSALRVLLEQEPGICVAGEATEAEGLLTLAKAIHPDLVLLDWELPSLHADGVLSVLLRTCPNLLVIVLSVRPEARLAALTAGASAFVSKGDPPERLLAAIGRANR